jgi:hypothetical protein
MKLKKFYKLALVGAVVASMVRPVNAVDMRTGSGMLAEIASIVVQAKLNLAIAANSGDVEALAEASKRSDGVDSAMAEAMNAFSAMERAIAGGDDDAAASAFENVSSALQKAKDALNGSIPDQQPVLADNKAWEDSQKNAGGGVGNPYDEPNIYNVLWNTENMESFYQGLFNEFIDPSSFTDKPATPE